MKFLRLYAVLTALVLSGCSAGSTGAPPVTSVNPVDPSYSKLQFSVGTANIYGSASGLNVVATLRQPDGTSAIGVSTPSITGPFTFGTAAAAPAVGASLPDPYTTIPMGGPSLPETVAATPAITGTPQTLHPGTPYCDGVGTVPSGFTACPATYSPDATTFGQSGGVFAMGLAPYNAVASTGQAYSYAPYTQPIYDLGAVHPAFLPWGGPPAFDPDSNGMGTRDGLNILGVDSFNQPYFLGVAEGITVFEGVAPASGSYSLNVQIATIGNNGAQTVNTISKSASLNTATALPTLTAPQVNPDSTGDGGATFSVALPPGVTEELIQIVDWGPGGGPTVVNPNTGAPPYNTPNCQGPKGTAFAPVYYTIAVHTSGAYTLPATDGPNTNLTGGLSNLTPSPSICTAAQNTAASSPSNPLPNAGDNFTVQAIGFDYPLYEAAVSLTKPSGVPQTPAIAGSAGQSDITISVPAAENAPGYVSTPLSARRAPAPMLRSRRGVSLAPLAIPRYLGVPQR